MMTPEQLLQALRFWGMESLQIHESFLAEQSLYEPQQHAFLQRFLPLFLQQKPVRKRLASRICEKYEIPKLPESRQDMLQLEESIAQIVALPPDDLVQTVCLPIGCVLLATRIRKSIDGQEVRHLESILEGTLFSILRTYGVMQADPIVFPAAKLRFLTSDSFLSHAKEIGTFYIRAAAELLEWQIAVRLLLKLPTASGLLEECKEINFQMREKRRVWMSIVRSWNDIGLTCFSNS